MTGQEAHAVVVGSRWKWLGSARHFTVVEIFPLLSPPVAGIKYDGLPWAKGMHNFGEILTQATRVEGEEAEAPAPNEPKPARRRVVQITANHAGVYALCDDGSLWWLQLGLDHRWEWLADAPQTENT